MDAIGRDDRYMRQILIDGFGVTGQERLAGAKVLIAGTGGLGSPQAMYLAGAGVGAMTLLDMDEASVSNLNRQILHWEADVGRAKVESAAEKLRRINSSMSLEIRQVKITTENANDLVNGHDVVLDGLDNFETRKILNRACLSFGVPFIFGGVEGLSGMLSVFIAGRTACLECVFPGERAVNTVPVLGATAGVIGCLQATEAVKLIVGLGRPLYDRLLIYDGSDMTFRKVAISHDEQCPACGHLKRI